MKARGAIIVEGDLMKPETLLPICEGVEVVVSAVGNNNVTVPTTPKIARIVVTPYFQIEAETR